MTLATPTGEAVQNTKTTTVFDDVAEVVATQTAVKAAPFPGASNPGVELGAFFGRPVHLTDFSWTGATATTHATYGTAWCNITAINARLTRFATFRGTMVVRFVVNGTPFHYGRMLFAWLPHQYQGAFDTGKALQLPHVAVDPSQQRSYEIRIPPLSRNPILGLAGQYVANPFADAYGDIYSVPLVALQHASMASPPPVGIAVYVYFEDVELTQPMPGSYAFTGPAKKGGRIAALADSMSEAHGVGPIQGVADAVGNAAKALSDVPIIGGFASAVAGAASIGSKIASLFGWSRPVIDVPLGFVKQKAATSLSAMGAPDGSLTFTAYTDTGVSTDPTDIGAPAEDEMALATIWRRPGLMDLISWSSSDTPGTVKETYIMNPCKTNLPAHTLLMTGPPMAWVANAFRYWRGSIVLRFEVVGTQYHSGRLQFRYIPSYVPVSSGIVMDAANAPTAEVCILDLAAERTLDMVVHYAAPAQMLLCGAYGDTYSNLSDNGVVEVSVLTALTGIQSSETLVVVVTARAGEDFVAFCPTLDVGSAYTYTGPEVRDQKPVVRVCAINTPAITAPDVAKIYFGEVVGSIRALVKRFSAVTMLEGAPGAAVKNPQLVLTMPLVLPPMSQTVTASYRVTAKSFLAYFAPAYIGARGSLRYKFQPPVYRDTTTRHNTSVPAWVEPTLTLAYGLGAPLIMQLVDQDDFAGDFPPKTWNGSEVQPTAASAGGMVEVTVPDFNTQLFYKTWNTSWVVPDGPGDVAVRYQVTMPEASDTAATSLFRATIWMAAGEDFSLVHYVCTPYW